MKPDRRSFIKTGSLSLAFTGLVPAFLQSCNPVQPDAGSLPDITGDVVPLTDADYLARQDKARRLMTENDMDALWIEGGINMSYFFDVSRKFTLGEGDHLPVR